MSQSSANARQTMPVWLGIILVLLALGGGAWLVYKYAIATKDQATADSIPWEGPGMMRGPRVEAGPSFASRWGFGPSEGVEKDQRRGGRITARRGDVYLRAYPTDKGSFNIAFDYLTATRQSWLKPEQWELHALAYRIQNDSSLAQQLRVSDEQKRRMQALPYAVPITAAERNTLQSLVAQWDKSTGPDRMATGRKLLETIVQLGNTHLAATKAAMLKRVEQIQTILTAQQIQQGRSPSTQPTQND